MTLVPNDYDVNTVNALRDMLAELVETHGIDLVLDVAAVNLAHYASMTSKGQLRQKGMTLIVPEGV